MTSNSATIEDLKRRLMESWSLCDDNEDITGTYLDMRDEPMTSPSNLLYNNSPNISKMNSSTSSSYVPNSADEYDMSKSASKSATKTSQQSVSSPSSGKGFLRYNSFRMENFCFDYPVTTVP